MRRRGRHRPVCGPPRRPGHPHRAARRLLSTVVGTWRRAIQWAAAGLAATDSNPPEPWTGTPKSLVTAAIIGIMPVASVLVLGEGVAAHQPVEALPRGHREVFVVLAEHSLDLLDHAEVRRPRRLGRESAHPGPAVGTPGDGVTASCVHEFIVTPGGRRFSVRSAAPECEGASNCVVRPGLRAHGGVWSGAALDGPTADCLWDVAASNVAPADRCRDPCRQSGDRGGG